MNWTQPAFADLARLVGAKAGLAFEPGRRVGVESGIRRAMARAGFDDPARYRDRVEADGEALDALITELTVGETYFFREPGQFEFLRREILPEIRRLRGEGHALRAWSAGCASGEEAYSLAMVFAEERPEGRDHLLATDISRAALARAERAAYREWSLRGEGAEAARPHLRRVGDHYVVAEAIRRRVTLEYLNLALDAYPTFATGTWGMDLILCRNVLIYLDRKTVRAVASRLFASLADGGWLLTASSDPPLAAEAPFESVVTEQGVFYRRGAARHAGAFFPLPTPPPGEGRGEGASLSASATDLRPKHADGAILNIHPPPRPSPTRGMGVSLPPSPLVGEGRGGGGAEAWDTPIDVFSPLPEGEGTGVLPAGEGFPDVIARARSDLARGEYARAADRTRSRLDIEGAAALHVRALANLDPAEAERACAEASARHPCSAELHYLRAVLLLDLGRDDEAAQSARRAIYLDRTLAVAHFTLGTIARRLGDVEAARRGYRNARDLCRARPADEEVALSDGEPAGRLAEAAGIQLALLGGPGGRRR